MITEAPSIKPIAYSYGLYLALLSIAGIVISYALGLENNWILSSISFLITVIIYVYGIKSYKKLNGNLLTVKEAIKTGLAMAVVSGIIAAIYAIIHYGFIQPEYIDKVREDAYLQMTTQSPNMTEEQLASATDMMNLFTSKFFMATMFLISSLFFGFFISLIIGLIMKKEAHLK